MCRILDSRVGRERGDPDLLPYLLMKADSHMGLACDSGASNRGPIRTMPEPARWARNHGGSGHPQLTSP